MGEIRNPTIRISNFGPINKATIAIKPLTIFIGGHNTGKSYAAQMIYFMARALRGDHIRARDTRKSTQLISKVMRGELRALEKSARPGVEIKFSEIGKTLQSRAEELWVSLGEACKSEMISSINQYFVTEDVGELVRFNGESVKCSITFSCVGENGAKVTLKIGKPGKVNVQIEAPDVKEMSISKTIPLAFDYSIFRYELNRTWRKVWKGITDYDYYYLPAARSGILQLWGMLQVYVLDMLSEKMGLPGFVRDFFANMARIGMPWGLPKRREATMQVLEILEGEILKGEITYEERGAPITIDYKFKGASINIQRASSMVAELGPLDLWIKRLLDKGDLLIIEEPEAHLHPSSQIQVAKLIARLVNSGIRVLCTTHSSLLVNRISNLMLAGKAGESVRKELGLKQIDIVKEEDLAVYQFVAGDDGSEVQKLQMVSKFGIPEDEFLREYEKISLESYKVSS